VARAALERGVGCDVGVVQSNARRLNSVTLSFFEKYGLLDSDRRIDFEEFIDLSAVRTQKTTGRGLVLLRLTVSLCGDVDRVGRKLSLCVVMWIVWEEKEGNCCMLTRRAFFIYFYNIPLAGVLGQARPLPPL
jgi:hypothetical protein